MKHLRIEVNGMEYVNGEFAEITFNDGPNGIRVEGKNAPAGGGGNGLLDLLTNASRNRAPEVSEPKRENTPPPVVASPPPAFEAAPVEIIHP